jgi:hypothetical protein
MNALGRRLVLACASLISVAALLPAQRCPAQQGTIFWVDGISKLGRVNLDGSGFQVLFNNLANPISVDVDMASNQVWWVEGGAPPNYKVRRANFDGSNPATIATAAVNEEYLGLAIDGGTVYWLGKKFISSSQGIQTAIHRVTTAAVPGLDWFAFNGFSPLPQTIDYDPFQNLAFVSPGLYGGIEAVAYPNSMAPYFPNGGNLGLATGELSGIPTVFMNVGNTIEYFDATMFLSPPTTVLPVPVAAAPIYGIDYSGSFAGRLVWGTVGATQSQLFTSLATGAAYQVVYTGPEKFVDVAFVPIVPPVPEPATLALALVGAVGFAVRRRARA